MYHDEGVFFITDSKEAADILATTGCEIEEWDLITVDTANEIKNVYENMKAYHKSINM